MTDGGPSSDGSTRREALGLAGVSSAGGLSVLAGCASFRSSKTDESASGESDGPGTLGSDGEGNASGSGGHDADGGDGTGVYATDAKTPLGMSLDGNPVQGANDAPVDLYYWSDFQCPFCKRFEENTRPQLVEQPVANGQVRLVYLQFPKFGSASNRASAHAKCVWRQVSEDDPGGYLDWHSAVYDAQGKPNSGWASQEKLRSITESVDGVSRDAVVNCLEGSESAVRGSVRADVQRANEHVISVTPSFLLHDKNADETRKISGAQPYERFASAIRKMLA